jgi:hypothetical protein
MLRRRRPAFTIGGDISWQRASIRISILFLPTNFGPNRGGGGITFRGGTSRPFRPRSGAGQL